LPPEGKTTIVGNRITGSGRTDVPIRTALAGFVGVGIAIAGGNENVVRNNRVTGSERYGIAGVPTARYVTVSPAAREPAPPWRPRANRVERNAVLGSGWADLALAAGSGRDNCFRANTVKSTLPHRLQLLPCGAGSTSGAKSVAGVLAAPVRVMFHETI